MNNSTRIDSDIIIWLANEKEMVVHLPAIYFAGAMMTIGLIGNGFVAYVYGHRFRPTCANTYIYWLSIFDLICCVVSIPFEIFQIRFPVMYGDVVPCKLFRTASMVAYCSEGLMLLGIALDRYYKICHPLKTFLIQSPNRNVIYTFMLALCISWPTAFVYGTKTVKMAVPGVVSTTCSIDDSLDDVFAGLYYGFLLFVVIGGFIMLLFIYIRIVRAVWQWSRSNLGESTNFRLREMSETASTRADSNQPSLVDIFVTRSSREQRRSSERHLSNDKNHRISTMSSQSSRTVSEIETISVHSRTSSQLLSTDTGTAGMQHKSEVKQCAHVSKTTFIFIIVSASFVFSYVPYLITEILLKCNIVDFREQSFQIQQVMEVAAKTYCINNASNPIIYSIFNRAFRRECCRLFSRTV